MCAPLCARRANAGIDVHDILIVDDEFAERDGLRFLIESAGLPLRIHEAPNGEVALEYLKMNPVDILLTDIRMPFMDGLALSEAARALHPALIVLFYTAYGEFDYAMRAIKIHAFGYILKPVNRDNMIGELKKAVEACPSAEPIELARGG